MVIRNKIKNMPLLPLMPGEFLVCISSQTRQWHANGDQDTTQVRQ